MATKPMGTTFVVLDKQDASGSRKSKELSFSSNKQKTAKVHSIASKLPTKPHFTQKNKNKNKKNKKQKKTKKKTFF